MEYDILGFAFTSITAVIAGIVFYLIFQAIFIWFGTKIAQIKKASFGKAFGAAIAITILLVIINVLFGLVEVSVYDLGSDVIGLIFSVLLTVWVIKSVFDTNWMQATIAWIMSIVGVILATLAIAYALDLTITLI